MNMIFGVSDPFSLLSTAQRSCMRSQILQAVAVASSLENCVDCFISYHTLECFLANRKIPKIPINERE